MAEHFLPQYPAWFRLLAVFGFVAPPLSGCILFADALTFMVLPPDVLVGICALGLLALWIVAVHAPRIRREPLIDVLPVKESSDA